MEGLKAVADAAHIRRLSLNVGQGHEQKWNLFRRSRGADAPLGSTPPSMGRAAPGRSKRESGFQPAAHPLYPRRETRIAPGA